MILEVLRRYDVKGCVGRSSDIFWPGCAVPFGESTPTIGNMGTETGATTSIFPSDERTREYLEAQGRGGACILSAADEGAAYDEQIEIDLPKLELLIAKPTLPGNVVRVAEVAGLKVDQAIVGSSVNFSSAI